MKTCKTCEELQPLDNFPKQGRNSAYHVAHCKPCYKMNQREKSKGWYERNREAKKHYLRQKYADHKRMVFDHYGKKCECCSEAEPLFLTIDHMDNDGYKHRKSANTSHHDIYGWLVRNGFPERFQVLCMNCNQGKHRNNGVCPHNSKAGYDVV